MFVAICHNCFGCSEISATTLPLHSEAVTKSLAEVTQVVVVAAFLMGEAMESVQL